VISYLLRKKKLLFSSLAIILLVLGGLIAYSGVSVSAKNDKLPADLKLIRTSRRLIDDYGSEIWPGFGDFPASVLLSAGEYDYLVGHPNPPDGFEKVKDRHDLYRKKGHLLQHPAATSYPVGGVWSVAIPARKELVEWVRTIIGNPEFQLSQADYLRTLIHESFHAFQMSSVGGPGKVPDFGHHGHHGEIQRRLSGLKWWEDRILEIGRFLVRILEAENLTDTRAATRKALKLTNGGPSQLTSAIVSFEKTIQWLEGTARYAGTMAMINSHGIDLGTGTEVELKPPAKIRSDLTDQLTKPLTGPTPVRDRLAAVGAVKAMVLDRLYPGWKNGFLENKLGLDELLNSAINVPEPLTDFPITDVKLNGEDLTVALANNGSRRSHGLQHVADLEPLDGMVFTFSRDVRTGFWMKDTEISLQIGFFGSDGRLQESVVLDPCDSSTCPSHTPEKEFRYVLELPASSETKLEAPNGQPLILELKL